MKGKKLSTIVFTVFKYAALVGISLITLTPVVVCILTAFKTTEEYNATSVLDLPSSFLYFEN